MGWKQAAKSRDIEPEKRRRKRAAKREAVKRGAVPAPKQSSPSKQVDHASSPRKRRHAREGAKKLGMEP